MAPLSKVRWMLFFLLFALPLLFLPFAYLAFELPKVFSLYLFSIFSAYILIVSGHRLGQFTKIHWLYLIFLSWMVFTAIFGLSLQQSFWGSYFRIQGILSWICYGFLFFISKQLFEDNHFRKHASVAILVGSITASSLAIIQFISLWFFGNTSQLLYSGRVISTFGQPNFLGAYLVMSLPFIWFLLGIVKSKWKILLWFALAIIILGVFSTLSRSAYLGLAILALVWGVYHYRLLLMGIIFSILLFAILANLFPNLVYKEWYRFQVDTISKWTAENRLVIAQKSVKLISQRPITGYGLENFSLAFPNVVGDKDLGLKDIVIDSSHNLFLDLAVQIGLVGVTLLLSFLVSTIALGLKQIRLADTDKRNFQKAAICVVIAFLVIHQFSPYSSAPMVLFWISIGIISGPNIAYFGLHKKIAKYLINFIGVSLAFATILFIIQTIRAEIFFRQASAYEVSDIHLAIKLDNESIKLAPWIGFYTIRRNFLLKQLGY